MLIGVDHAVERDTEEWVRRGGKQSFHADVMIVLAINKNTGEVNMISLPRDTYAADIETLCSIFGIPRPSWRVNYETTYNEIHVDFR